MDISRTQADPGRAMRETAIRRYLLDSSQMGSNSLRNGWVDNDSLRYELEWRTAAEAIVRVRSKR
jgi:hypothetical protein